MTIFAVREVRFRLMSVIKAIVTAAQKPTLPGEPR